MKTIEIKKEELITELATALRHAGSTDWDIYVNDDGQVSTRHNTYDNAGWYEIIDLYYSYQEDFDVEDAQQCREIAEWITDEDFELPEYEDMVEAGEDEDGFTEYETELTRFELID